MQISSLNPLNWFHSPNTELNISSESIFFQPLEYRVDEKALIAHAKETLYARENLNPDNSTPYGHFYFLPNSDEPTSVIKIHPHGKIELAAYEMSKLLKLDAYSIPVLPIDISISNTEQPSESISVQGLLSVVLENEKTNLVGGELNRLLNLLVSQNNENNSTEAIQEIVNNLSGNIDPISYQLECVLAFILGHSTSIDTLCLYEGEDKQIITTLSKASIMPESNDTKTFNDYVPSKLIWNEEEKSFEQVLEEVEVKDICAMQQDILTLPLGGQPFDKSFISYVLEHVSTELLENYHQDRSWFSREAVEAQLERVAFLREKFQQCLGNEITLTPRELFSEFMQENLSFRLLSQFQLPAIAFYHLLGRIPADLFSTELIIAMHQVKTYQEERLGELIQTASENEDVKEIPLYPETIADPGLLIRIQMFQEFEMWNEFAKILQNSPLCQDLIR